MSSHPPSDDHHREQQLELGDDDAFAALRRAWDKSLRMLAPKLNKRNVDNFLSPLKPLSFDGEIVVLGAPSAFAREWAEKKYAQLIRETLETCIDRSTDGQTQSTERLQSCPESTSPRRLQIRFVIAKPDVQPILGERPPALQYAASPKPPLNGQGTADGSGRSTGPAYVSSPFANELISTPLNDRFTFEAFVTGKSNQLAYLGASAVATSPGAVYNPLFLYGNPGLGKTHLMHAIGNQIRRERPTARVACISGETFTNHFFAAIREKRTEDFRRAYRSIDVWLVDDIHTIASREQTKEEFFHTFNTLHQMNKQIVLTLDRPPRDLRTMDEKLRSRFECGLTADVLPPEFETRKLILQRKAEREDLRISEDVIGYMANIIQSNIRVLEGALIKLMAYASLAKSPVTKQLANDVLSGYYVERMPAQGGHREVGLAGASADQVIDAVAIQLGVEREAIVSRGNRRRDVTFARQVAMYLCKEMSKAPMTAIAATFDCKDHSAVAHAHARMRQALESDPKLLATIANIRNVIEYSL